MLDIKMSPEIQEFYDKYNVPESLRKEAEFMAIEITIAGRRTGAETMKLGGYIYWTHRKFTEEVSNWSLDKTQEWLEKHGIRFSTRTLKTLINIYTTYSKSSEDSPQLVKETLTELYARVNNEVESLSIPQLLPVKIFDVLFPGLEPSSNKQKARDLIQKAIREGLIEDILQEDPEFAREFRKHVEQWVTEQSEYKQKLRKLEKELEQQKNEKKHLEGTIQKLVKQIADLKEKARKEVEEKLQKTYQEDIDALEEELKKKEKKFKQLEEKIEAIEKERDNYEKQLIKRDEELEKIQDIYNKLKAEYEEIKKERDQLKEAFEDLKIKHSQTESKYKEVKDELNKLKEMNRVYDQISRGFSLLDQAIHLLGILNAYRAEFYDANPKLISYYVKELDKRIDMLKAIREHLAEMNRVITIDGGEKT